MQASVLGEAFDRHHLVPLGLGRKDEARTDEPAVEQHRARAALTLLARILRAREPEPLPQREEQALALPDIRFARLAVDVELDPHQRHRSRARLVRMRSA